MEYLAKIVGHLNILENEIAEGKDSRLAMLRWETLAYWRDEFYLAGKIPFSQLPQLDRKLEHVRNLIEDEE